MENKGKTEVEIILKNGKSIMMHCESCTVLTNAFGCITSIKYSSDCDTWILYIDGAEIAAVVQRGAKEGT